MKDGWHRYRVRDICPCCAHGGRMGHGSGCMYFGPLENPVMVLCLRTSQGAMKEARDGMGYIHKMREDKTRPAPRRATVVDSGLVVDPKMGEMAIAFERAVTADSLAWLSVDLGVPVESLHSLRVGWDAKSGAYSFPMRAAGNLVIGIRLRKPDGAKFSVPNSRNGLFIPRRVAPSGVLYVVEGASDAAAMIGMGFAVIGRPSNTAGRELICDFCKRYLPRRDVVIIRNSDPVGSVAEHHTIAGAESLAESLMSSKACSSVSIVFPPVKDVRAWRNQGCTRHDIESLSSSDVECLK